MADTRVKRTGQAPLSFTGEVIAEASGKWSHGVERSRWHEVAVYRTAAGKLVLAITYRTQWQGEADRHTALVCATEQEVADELAAYDAADDATGLAHLRSRAVYAPEAGDKAARIEASIRDDWQEIISEIVEALGIEERID